MGLVSSMTWEGRKRRALDDVRANGVVLRDLGEELQADRDVVLEAVRSYGLALQHASEELRGDRIIVLEAVACSGDALQYASEELRADKVIVYEAVRQTGEALLFASDVLKTDKEVVLEAVQRDGYALRCAGAELRADKATVLEAVKRSGRALQYASRELRADKSIVLDAIQCDGTAVEFASEEARADEEIVLEAVKQCGPEALLSALGGYRRDKDLLLLAARSPKLRTSSVSSAMLDVLLVAAALEGDLFQEARRSSIAVRGEEAPILSVALSHSHSSNGKNEGAMFRCEACLMSGAKFECCMADESKLDRPCAILNDLAQKLVAALPEHVKASGRVFMNFTGANDSGEMEVVPVTPWDWNRPLRDFLPALR